LNDGRFAGARLDTFSSKKSDAGRINTWYEKKEFKPIEHTLRDEAESFLKLFQYLSKYKTRMGIARKGKPAPEKPEQATPPSPPEKPLPPHPESPAPSVGTPEKQADTGKPAPHKSSAQLAKAKPRSPRKSPAQTLSPDQRSPAPGNKLLKYTPTKKTDGKKNR
jgi:DNA replication initiation complex subunit (GINS family)